MARWMSLAAFALLLLAGCISDADGPDGTGAPAEAAPTPTVQADPATAHLGQPAAASPPSPPAGQAIPALAPGKMLTWQGECPCAPLPFAFAADKAWDGWLEVRVQWDGTKVPDLQATLASASQSEEGVRGFDDRLVRLWDPSPGRYDLTIAGTGAYTATARLGSTEVPATGPLLPNLVELIIEGPQVGECDQVEQTEQNAVKCMRFGNGVGNPGHGPVQIRLTVDQAALALAPLDGRFSQEIRDADGSVKSHEVGPASFHVAHGHWHYDGLALFELYKVDPATGLRGDKAASHGKSGFCFLDWDKMVEDVTIPAQQERAETDCLIPGMAGSWTNGISRGWYDFYESHLTDQYVDVNGLPDGLYELVASADPLKTLDELDENDNQSSLLLELSGDSVEVVEERGHFHVQDDDDA